MIIKNSQQDFILNVPKDITHLGIKISGGADSAIMFYMVCKYITEERPDIILYPITTEEYNNRYHFKFAKMVMDYCLQKFPAVQLGKYYKITSTPNHRDHVHAQDDLHNIINKENIIQGHFFGTTANPEGIEFSYKNFTLMNRVPIRDKTKEFKPTEIVKYFPKGNKNNKYITYKPFVNIDKRGVCEFYHTLGVIDLFKLTRSCINDKKEETLNWNGHCDNCWFCREREWVFGSLNNKYDDERI